MTLIRSWLESANAAGCAFPVNNLPYGVFSVAGRSPRCGVAIGDQVLDVECIAAAGTLAFDVTLFSEPSWNAVMALGPTEWQQLRERLQQLLAEGGDPALSGDAALQQQALFSLESVQLHMPFTVTEYTDFYAGRHHATNVGTMFRGAENALPPNWLHMPIGYNGRASSVVVSGTDIHRPRGQRKPAGEDNPVFSACRRLDFELELGAVVGTGNALGQPVTVAEADEMIFGYVLLNDWSARDIQAWEYQPLGPFQAKAFATSISPWIVTRAALEPFRVATPEREHTLLPYLRDDTPLLYDIELDVTLQPAAAESATTITRTNYKEMYYASAQQLAHHAISGCPMRTGDLLGSGTISGADKGSRGSLLELSWGGQEPLSLETGETRSFLEDGDCITLGGTAVAADYSIGFGECSGTVLAAQPDPYA